MDEAESRHAAMDGFSSPEVQLAAARSQTYRFFAEALEYPDAEAREAIADGTLSVILRDIFAASASSLLQEVDWEALGQVGDEEDALQIGYTKLFDVGASGPPCPLHGGLYGGDRMKNMEEVIRFYNYFGLSLSDEQHELPDHIITELEFLHYLCFREAEALQAGEDPGPFSRAQRDFVERHPGGWVPKLRARLTENHPMPFFRELVAQLDRYLGKERERLSD
jgi:DMSO reductase family type II enzyme chaperone